MSEITFNLPKIPTPEVTTMYTPDPAPEKKNRFSSHIMPRRIVRFFPWLCVESLVLYVLFKITAVVWRTLAYNFPVPLVIYLLLVCAMAAFPALWESLRLSRDVTVRGDFMASTADGSYDKKAESRMLLHCDELWNDTAVVAVLYLICLLYALFRVWFNYMTNAYFTYEESMMLFRNALIVNVLFYFPFVGMYAFWHHRLTLRVHTKWNADRMRIAGEVTAERKAYM